MSQFKIRRELAEQIIEALTSDEYEQGERALCTIGEDGGKQWCCLGIMMDLAVKAGVTNVLRVISHQDPSQRDSVRYEDPTGGNELGQGAYLTDTVVAWLTGKPAEEARRSFGWRDPAIPEDRRLTVRGIHGERNLSVINDAGVPFPVIAELIRDYLMEEVEETNAIQDQA